MFKINLTQILKHSGGTHKIIKYLGDVCEGEGVLGDGAGVVVEAGRVAARVVNPRGRRHRQGLFGREEEEGWVSLPLFTYSGTLQ